MKNLETRVERLENDAPPPVSDWREKVRREGKDDAYIKEVERIVSELLEAERTGDRARYEQALACVDLTPQEYESFVERFERNSR